MGAPAVAAPRAAIVAMIVTTGLTVALHLLPGPSWWGAIRDLDLTSPVISAVAAVSAGWRAVRSTGRRRRAWTALAAAIACSALGDTIWNLLQANGQEPFPSVADLAYLCFGPLVCVGLLLLPVGANLRRLQGVLDGLAASWALLLISWLTALGAVVRASEDDLLAFTVSASYPVMDVAVLVLTVLTLARARADTARLSLGLLAIGLIGISIADSTFVYLAAADSYQSGDPIDIVWDVGFGCLGLAALLDAHPDGELRETTTDVALPTGGLLPYVPVAAALAIVIVTLLTGYDSAPAEEAAVLGLILLLLARQYLTLRQNARLVVRLAARERELRHLAFHDALTGLPNRALFRNRLEHALDLHARDRRALAVLFLDLDDFKKVNDTLGHTAGDHLLTRIAERLHGATRTGDTVARLGGDEFAVLLETGGDPYCSAERLTGALRDPFFIAGHTIEVKVSIGVVQLTPHDPTVAADELLIRADTAMYATKRSHRAIADHVEHC